MNSAAPIVKKVHEEIKASGAPNTPLIWSEFNAAYDNTPPVTDSTYMGPWMAGTIAQCDGLVDIMSYWSFSDVFEEQGVVKTPFYGGFGLMAAGGLPKPAYNAFKLLHGLGDQRLKVDSDHVLATRRADGTLVVAVWNYAPSGLDQDADKADKAKSEPITVTLKLANTKAQSAQKSARGLSLANMKAQFGADRASAPTAKMFASAFAEEFRRRRRRRSRRCVTRAGVARCGKQSRSRMARCRHPRYRRRIWPIIEFEMGASGEQRRMHVRSRARVVASLWNRRMEAQLRMPVVAAPECARRSSLLVRRSREEGTAPDGSTYCPRRMKFLRPR